jgi:hypothetical protein
LKKGIIKKEDIPYMQRLGSWDGSDVGKKAKWNEDDKKYDQSQQVRVPAVDWQGRVTRSNPQQKKPVSAKEKKFGFF